MLDSLDTLIGFATILTIVSLLVTIVVQMIGSALALRGTRLADALGTTLKTVVPGADAALKAQIQELTDYVLSRPHLSDSTQATDATTGTVSATNVYQRAKGASWLLLLFPLLLASCAVMLVGPYDELTDQAVHDLAKRTEIVIADVTLSGAPYRQHASFYREAEGSLRAIEMRAGLYPKNEAELDLLTKLRAAFRNLQRTHREVGPFRPAEAEGVRSLLRSLIHHELSKKRSSGIGAPSSSS